MRSILTAIFSLFTAAAMASGVDTLKVEPSSIDMKALQKGHYEYIVYFKKSKEASSSRMTLINIDVESQMYHDKPAVVIKQRWEKDSVIHTAYSVFDAKDFSTILHDTWWARLGYSMKFDFEAKKVEYKNVNIKGGIPDSVIRKGTEDFNGSFGKYNLNWHSDLIVYTLLPYKENRTFAINYYDPGASKAEVVNYTITGSDMIAGRNGEKIDCWVLNHNDTNGYERFWIAKKSKEVLKEEDFFPKNGYRYKLKLGISGE